MFSITGPLFKWKVVQSDSMNSCHGIVHHNLGQGKDALQVKWVNAASTEKISSEW
jgi:hypothetical protein